MLRRMFKGRKAQSTAEYGILFAAIIAIAAGALTVSLKGAVGTKQEKALRYMLGAGTTYLDTAIATQPETDTILSSAQEVRKTTVPREGYVDERVRRKGGAESMHQAQQTVTESISITRMNAGAPTP